MINKVEPDMSWPVQVLEPASELLVVEGVWKKYRDDAPWVLRGVDLRVRRGEAVAIVGENGSGKTTLLRVIAGLLHASKGRVLVDGAPAGSIEARRSIGLVLHYSLLYDEYTLAENLEYYSVLYGVEDYDPARDPVVESLGLEGYLGSRARELSYGWRRRGDIARALIHRPRLLLIDEPFTGLDRRGVSDLAGVLSGMRERGMSVVATSPRAEDLEPLEPDTVYYLEGGRLVPG